MPKSLLLLLQVSTPACQQDQQKSPGTAAAPAAKQPGVGSTGPGSKAQCMQTTMSTTLLSWKGQTRQTLGKHAALGRPRGACQQACCKSWSCRYKLCHHEQSALTDPKAKMFNYLGRSSCQQKAWQRHPGGFFRTSWCNDPEDLSDTRTSKRTQAGPASLNFPPRTAPTGVPSGKSLQRLCREANHTPFNCLTSAPNLPCSLFPLHLGTRISHLFEAEAPI